jgi:hypothetical protein
MEYLVKQLDKLPVLSRRRNPLGWLLGPAVAAAYGYARVENSNTRRDQQAQPQPHPQFAQR